MPESHERRLAQTWATLNQTVFGGALKWAPSFMLFESKTRLAEWNPSARTIRFSRAFVHKTSWLEVTEVMKHEMVHQYVSDVLGVEDESAHGPAFQMVCKRHGIDGRASGSAPTDEVLAKVDKIRKLLTLGESENPHEAKVAMAQAHALMRKYGLDDIDAPELSDEIMGACRIGPSFNRIPSHHKTLAGILSGHFNVMAIWYSGDGRTRLEIVGTHGDLQIAEHVHDFLLAEGTRLWAKRKSKSKREREDFFEGLFVEFLTSLRAEEAAKSREPGLIVHRGAKKRELSDFFRARHPETRSISGSTRRRGHRFHEGRQAGRNINIRPPVESGLRPQLLGSGSRGGP